MKYMLVWSMTPENRQAVIKRFKEDSEPTDGIRQLGRWHTVGTGGGFRLIETDDPVAMQKTILYWADLMEIKVLLVLDDEETGKALGG